MFRTIRMRYIAASLAIVVLGAIATWWWMNASRIEKIIYDVGHASTAEEERLAFQALSDAHIQSGFMPIDRLIGPRASFQLLNRQGRQVDMSADGWWESVVTIRFEINGRYVKHTVIDPKNIDVLMYR